jgi:hypothetical protein
VHGDVVQGVHGSSEIIIMLYDPERKTRDEKRARASGETQEKGDVNPEKKRLGCI